MFEPIGRAVIKTDGLAEMLCAWIKKDNRPEKDGGNRIWRKIYSMFPDQRVPEFSWFRDLYNHWVYLSNSVIREFNEIGKEAEKADRLAKECMERLAHAEEYEIPVKCIYLCEEFAVVTLGGQKSAMMLPPEVVEVIPYQDYDALSASERKALLLGVSDHSTAQQMSLSGGSLSDARAEREEAVGRVSALKQRMDDVKNAKTAELAKLQAEIDRQVAELEAKKTAMMEALKTQMAAMEAEMEKMEFQIHILDSEIYAIRCYTGEIVEFHSVRKGAPAPANTPIVFYQKMRYLDEELGKLASIYRVDISDAGHFDALLKYSPAALDVFAPSQRSIMLARVSRTGQAYYPHEIYGNLLDNYEIDHGKKICIVLRDGENVWTAWTDDERVKFDADAFLRPHEARPMTPEEEAKYSKDKYESQESYEKRMKMLQRQNLDEGFSRMFVYSILRGVFDRGMIKFPEKVDVMKPNPYVILSYAEGWLTDERYGTLAEMIERCNGEIAKGDIVMTVQRLSPGGDSWSGRSRYATWSNDRGRGEKNRTHDVDASDRTLYPINFIEHEAEYHIVLVDKSNPGGSEESEFDRRFTDEELRERIKNGWGGHVLKSHELLGKEEWRYYISLEKDKNWNTGAVSHANFELDPTEFWNLTYMNSRWLEYIYSTQKTNGVEIGGRRVDYAHLIPYLKTALEHVRGREEEFSEWLKEVAPDMLNDAEWPAQLSEWMLENKIHNFSKFRARQFAKWYMRKKTAGA